MLPLGQKREGGSAGALCAGRDWRPESNIEVIELPPQRQSRQCTGSPMAGGAWGSSRSVGFFRFDFDRHANPHRPPPCIPQVALPCEVAAMNTPYPAYPRLHALLGDALPGLALPTPVAEALEDALCEGDGDAAPSAFFARLRGIAQSHAADGQAWRERHLSESRGRELAEATRCLAAVSACGGVLLAAQSAREMDDAAAQCPPQVEEGLLHAVVVLADHAGGLVAPGARAGS